MDILAILDKINISQETKEAFNNATLLRPQLDKNNNELIIKFNNKKFIKSEYIQELKEKLTSYLEINVKICLNIEEEENVVVVMDYINYFCSTFNQRFALIPLIDEKSIQLDIDNNTLESIIPFFKQLGIKKEIINKKKTVEHQDIVVQANENKQNYYRNNTRSKFTKKEDYLLLSIDKLEPSPQKITCIGKVFSVESRSGTSKAGKYYEIESFVVSDFKDAIYVKRFKSDKNVQYFDVYEGQTIQIYGVVNYSDYDKQAELDPHYIEEVNDPFVISDDYDGQKHIDLHVHTNRSEMDGVSSTASLIKQAYKFGAKAIAITDNSVVQAYPLAQQALNEIESKDKDTDFKVIYGIDCKVVDDTLRIVHNPNDQKINNCEFCVLDLETTGLSTKYDYIIEFGGVIVKNNVVTEEKLQMFIKPPIQLPEFIVQKTNITNEMLKDALPIEQAIDKILDFIGDRVVVAHNADFDFNFLNDTLISLGKKPLKNVCLDTLNLAREVLKNRKYYRLGVIANAYHVDYDEETAHRGDYDAEVLAYVLIKMLKDIPDYENVTFRQIQENQDEEIYKKGHVYNATILAKNMEGIKAIYELVSLSHTKYLTYFAKENAKKIDSEVQAEPRITKSEINKRRENIIVGSSNQYSELFEVACNRSTADLKEIMKFYDYVEIQPLANYANLFEAGSSFDQNRLELIIKDIIKTADELKKPIIASNDVYYAHPYEKIAHNIYIMAKRIGGARHPLYPNTREKRARFIAPDQHLMTTKELLDAFKFTNREKEFVIDNPLMIANEIEKLHPIPTKLATPTIDGCEEILKSEVYKNAKDIYGDPLPDYVRERIEKELNNIIKNGFSVQYYIAYLLVKKSNEDGYPVGSRGSVGSSFIATMAKITEVNPLAPHYVCPKCKHSEFFLNNEYANGFDLPPKKCPECGEDMNRNGHNIPFETFLGFDGDKVPDIDLNFSADYQNKAQLLIRDIFGFDYSYRAGTIGTVAQKTAFGYVKGYCEEMEIPYYSKAYSEVLSKMCEDVKRTTGQHPGGIVVIPKEKEVHDFTPIQYPANNPFADWRTTHYAFSDLHDNILKLDILGHVDPTAIRLLSIFSGVNYEDVPMSDPAVYSLFYSIDALNIKDDDDMYHETNGAAGLPEFGTHNNRRILAKTKPKSFNELVALEGVTHGTDVWANNAEVLIDNGTCTLNDVISCRDDIMTYLIQKGMDKKLSFDIMEKVRKGKGLKGEWIDEMQKHDVPDWYINSCNLIKYMFPKGHAVAYAMNAVRVAWYKVHKPAAYYAVFFSCRCDAYDIETMLAGKVAIYNRLKEIQNAQEHGIKLSVKEEDLEPVLEIALEMYLRGYHFNNISLAKSEAKNFIIDPDDEFGIIPSFNSIDGLGEAVGNSIVEARNEREFSSKEDLQKRTNITTSQIQFMERIGVLDKLGNEDQMSLF